MPLVTKKQRLIIMAARSGQTLHSQFLTHQLLAWHHNSTFHPSPLFYRLSCFLGFQVSLQFMPRIFWDHSVFVRCLCNPLVYAIPVYRMHDAQVGTVEGVRVAWAWLRAAVVAKTRTVNALENSWLRFCEKSQWCCWFFVKLSGGIIETSLQERLAVLTFC